MSWGEGDEECIGDSKISDLYLEFLKVDIVSFFHSGESQKMSPNAHFFIHVVTWMYIPPWTLDIIVMRLTI